MIRNFLASAMTLASAALAWEHAVAARLPEPSKEYLDKLDALLADYRELLEQDIADRQQILARLSVSSLTPPGQTGPPRLQDSEIVEKLADHSQRGSGI